MSRQAMARRFGPASRRFLEMIIGELLRSAPVLDSLGGEVFRRVLVQDTTVISMAKSNADAFPNNGNGKTMTAGIKVDLITELSTGRVLRSALCSARDSDQKLSEEVSSCAGGATWSSVIGASSASGYWRPSTGAVPSGSVACRPRWGRPSARG